MLTSFCKKSNSFHFKNPHPGCTGGAITPFRTVRLNFTGVRRHCFCLFNAKNLGSCFGFKERNGLVKGTDIFLDFLSECITQIKNGDIPVDDLNLRRSLIDLYSELLSAYEQ